MARKILKNAISRTQFLQGFWQIIPKQKGSRFGSAATGTPKFGLDGRTQSFFSSIRELFGYVTKKSDNVNLSCNYGLTIKVTFLFPKFWDVIN